jgi:5-(carboxyamino)imidazole ribonucleotide synthase
VKIGILGGGQLGRMLALAGYPLGLTFRFLDSGDPPVRGLAELIDGSFDDPAALDRLAAGVDVVSYEFENVPVASARHLADRVPVYPPPAALEAAQDRLPEKSLFRDLGIPTPDFAPASSPGELAAAIAHIGLPVVVKTRRMGYDGKGQVVVRDAASIDSVWSQLGGVPLIVEQLVPFDRELSIIAVRSRSGQTAFYPLVQNEHRGGILRLSIAPAPAITDELQSCAEAYAGRLMERLGYVGVLAVELFQVGDQLVANEMAPRVHNSGHWTIECAITSQFENHLRAILDWPLGDTAARGHCAMLNLIGQTATTPDLLSIPRAHLHLYGKSPRPGRKLGHITLCAPTPEALAADLANLRAAIGA